jgi:hypothetical protein
LLKIIELQAQYKQVTEHTLQSPPCPPLTVPSARSPRLPTHSSAPPLHPSSVSSPSPPLFLGVGAPMALPTDLCSLPVLFPWLHIVALRICWSFTRMSSSGGLSQDWNFKRGHEFEHVVFRKLNSPVHHPSSSPRGAFHLLAVFRRHTFRLSEVSVSLALHSILGGAPAGFHVTCFRDRHFRFSVASRHVGFMVRDLSRVTTTHFDVYFHLWLDRGADWVREWNSWQREDEASWQRVERRMSESFAAKHVSFALNLV